MEIRSEPEIEHDAGIGRKRFQTGTGGEVWIIFTRYHGRITATGIHWDPSPVRS
jgi:hypothetical protein